VQRAAATTRQPGYAAPVDRAPAVGCVLRDVRRRVHGAQIGDQIARV